MTDPTKARCDSCGVEGRVFVQHAAKALGKWHTWRECPACFGKSEGRAVAAIEEAERSGVA
jgi:DnaJ-class molecular chaperone